MAGLIVASPAVFGQDVEVATDPVGYVSVNLLAASDTRISVPMTLAPEFQGKPTNVDGSTITFGGINDAAGADFGSLDGHFIAVRSGDLAGLRATIIGNDAESLTVEDGVDLSGLATGNDGDSIQVIPHWTLATLFPQNIPEETEVHVTDRTEAGVNLPPTSIFVAFDGDWFDAGTFEPADNQVILPDESVIVRDSMGDDFNLVMAGSVPMFPVRDALSTLEANTAQDISLGLAVPSAIRLGDIQGAQEEDELFFPLNDETGVNKPPQRIFVNLEGSWFDAGTFEPADDVELGPGVGVVYRKAGTLEPQTDALTFTPGYLAGN